MAVARKLDYLSEAAYLDGERQSEVRHEYVDGVVTAMAGSSRRHNRIAFNIAKAVDTNVQGCEVYSSDVKVRLAERKTFYYPDVVVTCVKEDNPYFLTQPCLIVEVLSESTRRKDYMEKLLAYQSIPSLQGYLIVSQDEILVDYFYREMQGNTQSNWWVSHFRALEDEITLPCPGIRLVLADIYAQINFKDESDGQETT